MHTQTVKYFFHATTLDGYVNEPPVVQVRQSHFALRLHSQTLLKRTEENINHDDKNKS